MKIGDWVRRRGQKWHLVESVVAFDAVTRCGRRMDVYHPDILQVSEVMPLTRMIGQPQLCRLCHVEMVRGGVELVELVNEDDGSTAPVDAPDVPS